MRIKAGLGALGGTGSTWGRCPEGKRAETDAERIDMASLQIEPPRHFRFDIWTTHARGGMCRPHGDGEKARGS